MNPTQVALNIVDRYNIIKYAHQIPSTLRVRMEFDDFVSKLELSEEESATYTVTMGAEGITCSDDSYVRIYNPGNDFPVIYDAIKSYVADIEEAASGEQPTMDPSYVANIAKWLRKLVG